MEAEDRLERKIERLRRAAKLPPGKTFETFDLDRLPKPLRSQIYRLDEGSFVDRAENVICFGLPGVGKSHVAAAIGDRLVTLGRSVLYTPTYSLVQELLAAKRDLELPRKLRKLDNFEVLILDDIGYTQQNAEEVEVLFTLLAERYERRSVIITSNLVFSEWDKIFKNPMTTAAAIDRVVHHAIVLEFKVPSYRTGYFAEVDHSFRAMSITRTGRSRSLSGTATSRLFPAQRISFHFDFDSGSHQSIEQGVGHTRIGNNVVPLRHR